jgi:hypothetical protein
MAIAMTSPEDNVLYVVHPLDEEPEEKRSVEGLGPIQMTPSVRASLYILRGYLILIMLLVFCRVLALAGVIGHHIIKH